MIFKRFIVRRLEIGVQSVYEDIARDTNRGHTVRAVSESFHMAKDAGFKVCHWLTILRYGQKFKSIYYLGGRSYDA